MLKRGDAVKYMQIALDGPAGAGKSTIAKLLAKKLDFIFIDTGAMYRAVTLKAIRLGLNLNDENVFEFIDHTTFTFHDGRLHMDGKDVHDEVRETDISNNVSLVSSYLSVRTRLVAIQQTLAKHHNVVMDGRDIGTKVLPNADVKFFLTATIEQRALRRHQDNVKRNIKSDLEQLKTEIARRDHLDASRKHSPLKPAADAIIIDTSQMNIDDVVETLTIKIREVENYGV